MGKYNSSKTRVTPLFNKIGSDDSMLNELFKLFKYKVPKFENESVLEICYGKNEKRIPAPKSMLTWMLNNLSELNKLPNYGIKNNESQSYIKRKLLFAGDSKTLKEAIDAVSNVEKSSDSRWYVFEGKTAPDIYIKTKESIFIGEAKRTERNITTKTLWLKNRDQLIRHIDSLLDQEKEIYSFYLLENKTFKNYYEQSMKLYNDRSYFESNLKHRNEQQIDRAFKSFIGFIFWEDLAEKFDIPFPEINE
ncbi:MAG: hypothetical protein EOP00_02640 [Pedobacter sp.]|nr:MAG: hypothetical protein EOP00_02640 [Pedobacter sp.]